MGEQLDAHRKRVVAQHPGLTLTGLYNVLEALRSGSELSEKDKLIHDRGLVSVLRQLHDDLDAAVCAAYGWPTTLSDADILTRLVALNAQRHAEESQGIIHWLRPDYQTQARSPRQTTLALPASQPTVSPTKPKPSAKARKADWPKPLAERIRATEQALHQSSAPTTAAALAQHFAKAKPADVQEILETLVTLGRAQQSGEHFSA